jgi:hypothetical protein
MTALFGVLVMAVVVYLSVKYYPFSRQPDPLPFRKQVDTPPSPVDRRAPPPDPTF